MIVGQHGESQLSTIRPDTSYLPFSLNSSYGRELYT